MASLIRWKLPKSRSGRRPISVGKLLAREAEGKVFHKHSSTRALRELLNELPEVASNYRAAKGAKTLSGAGTTEVWINHRLDHIIHHGTGRVFR